MYRHRWDMLSAEMFQLRHRTSTWVLLSLWAAMGLFFGYVLPYLIETPEGVDPDGTLAPLLPDRFVSGVISGFPFYGGAIALMLGVLSIGSDFGWGTFKALFTQLPGRGEVFAARMGAVAIMLIPFVVVQLVIGAAASSVVAWREGIAVTWPDARSIVEAVLAGWLILMVWSTVGVTLSVVTRGTSLAIGIGIIWALVIEGLLAAFAASISWLSWVSNMMLRSNAYSLVEPLVGGSETDGPGAFSGPYVSAGQAALFLAGWIVVGLAVSSILLRRRDVA